MKRIVPSPEERRLYNQYQWVWDMIGTIEDYEKLARYIAGRIRKHENLKTKNILHLGCGSGCLDHHLKGQFTITGVDISEKMLESARLKNPECEYIQGDMKDFETDGVFDAVIIPESINYILSKEHIGNVFKNAKTPLKKDGLLLVIVGYDPENFPQDRTTVERVTNKNKAIELTFIENNYTAYPQSNSFEATFVFLIRIQGKLEIKTDIHSLGLFEKETFADEMTKAGFKACFIEDQYLEEIEQKGAYLLVGKSFA